MSIKARLRRWIVLTLAPLLCVASVRVMAQSSKAVQYTVLHTFGGATDAAIPYAGLARDSAGNFYGTSIAGGPYRAGAVYKMDAQGHEKVLYSFSGGTDGDAAKAALILDSADNLYGTTAYGGGSANAGIVFKIDPAGTETVLYRFTGGSDGGMPVARLLRDKAGNLYGTTYAGGDPSCLCGTVFKVSPAGQETVLHTFGSGTDGKFPQGGLTGDSSGNLYGTTTSGGTYGAGTVYKIDANNAETVIHSFNITDGWIVSGDLARDAAGNLYGTAIQGGSATACFCFGCGTVFKVDPSGNTTVLYAFGGQPDAAGPAAGVLLDSAGNVYGTSIAGGQGGIPGYGTVFEIAANGQEAVLYRFKGLTDGAYPYSSLVLDNAGNLYGTADGGGPFQIEAGIAFQIKTR